MIRINLLKVEKKEAEAKSARAPEAELKIKKKAPKGNLLIFLAILLLAVFAFLQKRALDTERGLLKTAQEEKKKLEPALAKLNLVEQQKSFLERKISLINRLKSLQGNAVRIMEGLSATLPEWVWLTEVTLTQQNVQIKGKALSNILISDYMRNLGSDGLFQNIGLLGSAQKSQQGSLFLEFTLSASVVPPQETTLEKKPAEQAKTKGAR